jgi:hypothetical protein
MSDVDFRRFIDSSDDLEALIGLTASGAQFANPWHDEIGEFAPKGTGHTGRSSKAEERRVAKLAAEKAKHVPKPTEDDVIQGQVDALLAREGLVRAGGDRRGNNLARRKRAKALAAEFGDGETCTCPDCGQRIAADPAVADKLGIDQLTQDKILVGTFGGSYKLENLIPTCGDCNQSRGDREGIGVTADVKQSWGSAERFTRQVVREHGDAIAQRFQVRRTAILKRKKITWEEHLADNPDALPQDFDQLRRPVGGSFTIDRLDRVTVDGVSADHELGVDDPVRVDIPREQLALDRWVTDDGMVDLVRGQVPTEPLASNNRAVLGNHRHQGSFANPWHDEIGRFAPKGSGTRHGLDATITGYIAGLDIPSPHREAIDAATTLDELDAAFEAAAADREIITGQARTDIASLGIELRNAVKRDAVIAAEDAAEALPPTDAIHVDPNEPARLAYEVWGTGEYAESSHAHAMFGPQVTATYLSPQQRQAIAAELDMTWGEYKAGLGGDPTDRTRTQMSAIDERLDHLPAVVAMQVMMVEQTSGFVSLDAALPSATHDQTLAVFRQMEAVVGLLPRKYTTSAYPSDDLVNWVSDDLSRRFGITPEAAALGFVGREWTSHPLDTVAADYRAGTGLAGIARDAFERRTADVIGDQPVTLYRGVQSDSPVIPGSATLTSSASSWTSDRTVAEWFANNPTFMNRGDRGFGAVATATVDAADIIGVSSVGLAFAGPSGGPGLPINMQEYVVKGDVAATIEDPREALAASASDQRIDLDTDANMAWLAYVRGFMSDTLVASGNPWHDEIGQFAPKGTGTNFANIARRADQAEQAGSQISELDLEQAAVLNKRLIDFAVEMGYDFANDQGVLLTRAALRQRHGRGTMNGLAATNPDGQVLGAIAYNKNPGDYHIEFLGSTGLVKGVGSQLTIPVMEQAAADGAKVTLMVAAGSDSAGPFWESMGFQRDSATSNNATMQPDDVQAWVNNLHHEREGALVGAGAPEGWDPDDDRWAAHAIELGLMQPTIVASAQFANPWHDEIGRFAPKGTGTMSRNVTDDFAEPPSGYIPEAAAEWRAAYDYMANHEMPEWWMGTEIMDVDGLPKRDKQVGQNWDHPGILEEMDAWKAEVGDQVAGGVWSIGRAADSRREQAIRAAISTNQIDLDAAEERWGKYDMAPISGGKWEDLPPVLYHATSALSAIAQSGTLMTRDEIGGRKNAAGLGGGADDTISFTSDKGVAEGIVRSLHEVRRAINTDNETLRADLEERAGPWWPEVVASYKSIHGKTDGQTDTVEDRYNLYRVYAMHREERTGVLDPLFFNVDANRLATMNPDDIGIVTVQPAMQGARGYQVSALGEWRTPTGAATQIVNTERLDDQGGFTVARRMAFANPWHDEVGKFAPKGTGRKVEEALSSPGAGTVGAVDMWAAAQARQGTSALRNAIIKAREAARGFDTIPDNVLAAVADEHGLTGADANLVAGSLMYRAGIAALSEKRLNDKAEELGVDPAELEQKLVANAQRFVDESTLSMRMSSDTLDTILNGDGEIKSQFETATSKGAYDPALRAVAEASHFGLDPNSDPHDRPVYGYLVPPSGDVLPAGSYGDVRLVMKPDVRDRTTATFADSLGSEVRPAYLNQIDLGAVAPGMYTNYDDPGKSVSFVEAQIHGDTRIDDVAEAHFDYPPDEALRSRLEERGIKVVGPGLTAAAEVMEFANPWHDEIGRFAPKGTGSQSGDIVAKLDAEESDAEFAAKYGNERRSGDGDCFEVGLQYIHAVPAEDADRYRLCHGVPEGQGEIEGLRFDHCWIERTDPLPDNMPEPQRSLFMQYEMNITVIDKSNGNDVEMPRLMYYQMGNIRPADVKRYTADEARREAIRTGVYGPWT